LFPHKLSPQRLIDLAQQDAPTSSARASTNCSSNSRLPIRPTFSPLAAESPGLTSSSISVAFSGARMIASRSGTATSEP